MPRSLAEFKIWLATPGVKMACIQHDLMMPGMDARLIQSVDNLGWTFNDGQRCLFRSSKAWQFRGDRAIFTLTAETTHTRVLSIISYRLINPN